MIKKWRTTQTKKLADYFVFSALAKERTSPTTGKTHTFYTLEAPDWANVIALTKDNKTIMVRQYRHGIDDVTLEFPAGIADRGENIVDTIQRELLEETGYRAHEVLEIGRVTTNPAFMNNQCFTYLARDVEKIKEQELDDTENIDFIEVPIKDIPHKIATHEITHSLSIAAYYFYAEKTRKFSI